MTMCLRLTLFMVAPLVCLARDHAWEWLGELLEGDRTSVVVWKCDRCRRHTAAFYAVDGGTVR